MPRISNHQIKKNIRKNRLALKALGVAVNPPRPAEACLILRDGTLLCGGRFFWGQDVLPVFRLLFGEMANDEVEGKLLDMAGLVLVNPADHTYGWRTSTPTNAQQRMVVKLSRDWLFMEK